MMKYTELTRIRARELLADGTLTEEEFCGTSDRAEHVCWFVCVDQREDWHKCEVCGQWDKERKPSNE